MECTVSVGVPPMNYAHSGDVSAKEMDSGTPIDAVKRRWPTPSITKHLCVDLEAARRHLHFLDPEESRHTFQVAPDVDGAPRRIFHGPLDALAPHLVSANEAGAGVFVMVNAGDLQGRKRENVVRVRFVFVDLDGAPMPEPERHQAHGVVYSSPGRVHLYWRVTGVALEHFRPVQVGMGRFFGGDTSVCDPPRVLRLAGFLHRKRAPHRVTAWWLDHAAQPLTLADLCALFPPVGDELRKAQEAQDRLSIRPTNPPRPIRPAKAPPSFAERLLKVVERKAAGIVTTGRHELIVWTARACLDNGLSESEAEALTLRARDLLPARANGPLPDTEVVEAVAWAYANLSPGEPWGRPRPRTGASAIVPPRLAAAAARCS